MSVGYFATLAGERGKVANANFEAAHSWHQRADQLENALLDEQDKNWRLQHQLNEAHQLNASWQAHAKQLEEKVRNWQQSAIQCEAEARASVDVTRLQNDGKGPRTVAGPEKFDAAVEAYKKAITEEWGVNPWENQSS
jgi:predicted  nucleic acid-binding Zn-ribbon protein